MSQVKFYSIVCSEYPDVLTIPMMCKILGIGKTLAYQLIKDDTIKCRRIGRNIRISKVEMINYLMNHDDK